MDASWIDLHLVFNIIGYIRERLNLNSNDILSFEKVDDTLEIRVVWFRGREPYYFKKAITEMILQDRFKTNLGQSFFLEDFICQALHVYEDLMEDFKHKEIEKRNNANL